MPVYCYTFPIPNYYEDDVFDQHIYFEGNHCPDKETVIAILKANHDEQVAASKGQWWEGLSTTSERCLACIETAERWPKVGNGGEGSLVATNTFCETKFGRKPLSVKLIQPFKIPEE